MAIRGLIAAAEIKAADATRIVGRATELGVQMRHEVAETADELVAILRAHPAEVMLSDFLPVQGARGLGLFLIDRLGPLRRAVMREGVTPAASQPRLMRGEAL